MKHIVSFEDDSEEKIVASFGCPQDPKAWPYLGEVESDDPRWIEYASGFAPGTFPEE